MPDHGRQVTENAADRAIGEALVSQATVECLDGVRHNARIETAVHVDQLRDELGHEYSAPVDHDRSSGNRLRRKWGKAREACRAGRGDRWCRGWWRAPP